MLVQMATKFSLLYLACLHSNQVLCCIEIRFCVAFNYNIVFSRGSESCSRGTERWKLTSRVHTMCAAMRTVAVDALRALYGSSKADLLLCSSPLRGGVGGASLRSRAQAWSGRGNCAAWTFSSPKKKRSESLVLAPVRAASMATTASVYDALDKPSEPLVLAPVCEVFAPVRATSMTTRANGRSTLKERLQSGEQLYGAFSVSFSPVVAEILGWSGYDFVVVDLEHGPGDTMAAVSILQALSSTGTPAIVRIPVNDPVWAKKALDLGPTGIMFPMINDANAARDAVRSCRYPPAGIRGAAYPIVRAARYGLDPSYLSRCEDDLLIMCQIESQQAVDNIADIAAVDGVDCIQMGPLDLRSDMGLLRVPDDKRPSMLLREAEKALKSSGVYLGGFATTDDSPSKLLKLGYHMVSGAIDIALLRNSALADIRNARG